MTIRGKDPSELLRIANGRLLLDGGYGVLDEVITEVAMSRRAVVSDGVLRSVLQCQSAFDCVLSSLTTCITPRVRVLMSIRGLRCTWSPTTPASIMC